MPAIADLRDKAQRLRARGVRRVFAILVKRGQVMEWSAASCEFVPVGGEIRDPSLRMPLSVQALLQASEADDAVARALLAKGNPVLARLIAEKHKEGQIEGRREGQIEGHREGEEGLRQAVYALCEVLEIQLTEDRRTFVTRANLADLQVLVQPLKAHRSWPTC